MLLERLHRAGVWEGSAFFLWEVGSGMVAR